MLPTYVTPLLPSENLRVFCSDVTDVFEEHAPHHSTNEKMQITQICNSKVNDHTAGNVSFTKKKNKKKTENHIEAHSALEALKRIISSLSFSAFKYLRQLVIF